MAQFVAATIEAPEAVAQPICTPPTDAALLTRKIAIVDDEPINCKLVRKYLSMAGYTSFATITESTEAMATFEREQPDLILMDLMMPEVSGLDLLGMVRASDALARVPVLILTAAHDAETKARALQAGATDFLGKPFDSHELLARVRNALVLKQQTDELAQSVSQLAARVRERTAELTMTQLELVHCLGRAAECRDNDTGNHVVRVGRYSGIIARAMNLDADHCELIEHAAPLHDIGKIGIPDSILLKPDRLSPDERDWMQRHAVIGKEVLQPVAAEEVGIWRAHADNGAKIIGGAKFKLLAVARTIALTHHEKWDGTGYPLGLKGTDIPLEGRIVAVADVFDALSSKRPYKAAIPLDECFARLAADRGTHFDPDVLDAFLSRRSEILETQMSCADR